MDERSEKVVERREVKKKKKIIIGDEVDLKKKKERERGHVRVTFLFPVSAMAQGLLAAAHHCLVVLRSFFQQ